MKLHSTITKFTRLKLFGLLTAMVFVISSCEQEENAVEPVQNLPELTAALEAFDEEIEYVEYYSQGESNARWGYRSWKRKPTFFTLVSALNYTGLLRTVVKEKLTIFAPDDKAFAELGLNFWNIRRKVDKETLTTILLNHVSGGFIYASDLDCSLQTLGKTTLRVVEVNGGLVFQDDSDEAANILFTDRKALNSVFHGIDKVLLLDNPVGTIADIAIDASNGSSPQFTQLVAALSKAGLVGAVSNPMDNLTVFAPTDEAFQRLYDALPDVDGIEDLSVDILTRVLTHHVVGARVFSNCLVDGPVPTLNQEITINASDFEITSSSKNTVEIIVSDETVDIKASNGVIHVIKDVLIPANYLEPLP